MIDYIRKWSKFIFSGEPIEIMRDCGVKRTLLAALIILFEDIQFYLDTMCKLIQKEIDND